jgi:hypothetical protein
MTTFQSGTITQNMTTFQSRTITQNMTTFFNSPNNKFQMVEISSNKMKNTKSEQLRNLIVETGKIDTPNVYINIGEFSRKTRCPLVIITLS